jgi:hypothetical protein
MLAAPAAGELVAARVGADDFARLRAGGPDAVIGLGDWALSNGTLCAGVSDPGHENDLSPSGGTLMDLGHCGRGDDQFLVFEQPLNLSTRTLVPIARVVAEQDGSEARLVTRGTRDGLAGDALRLDLGSRRGSDPFPVEREDGARGAALRIQDAIANITRSRPSRSTREGSDPPRFRGCRSSA